MATRIYRIKQFMLTALVLMILPSPAYGITKKKTLSAEHAVKLSSLTTAVATKAQSDVAVRRLKKLFAAQKIEPQIFYQKLKSLRD